MVTFKAYLSEAKGAISIDDAIAGIQKECQPFLKANRDSLENDMCIFRGLSASGLAYIGYPRADRKPKDTNHEFSELIDSYFNHKFGFKYRSNGLFCSTVPGQARNYGDVFIVFPCDDYKIMYSENVDDLYDLLTGNSPKYSDILYALDLDAEDVRNLYQKIKVTSQIEKDDIIEFDRIFDKLEYEETTEMQQISGYNFESGVELMLQCKSYYSLKIDNQGGSTDAMRKFIKQIYND